MCSFAHINDKHQQFLDNLARTIPEFSFRIALTRGGWHRDAGVVTAKGERISENIRQWVEQECAGDIEYLAHKYGDAGYIVTRLHGKTHYLVAGTGSAPEDFIQLEVEELQEVTAYPLINEKALPEDIDDLIDPAGVKKLDPISVGEPHYVFRRMTHIADYLCKMSVLKSRDMQVQRFIEDWKRSSAAECGAFSEHWVLALCEYTDAYGEQIMLAEPVSTCTSEIPRLEMSNAVHGSRLANKIHSFDRDIGYPMAWYFYMLAHSNVPHQLAEAIHHDQVSAYDYLPVKDLKVLIDWYNKPYSV